MCWCSYLPVNLIQTKSRLVILQHPGEEKRCLRTAKILELSLAKNQCCILRGKKFTTNKYPQLRDVVFQPENSFLLYPGENSIPIESIDHTKPYNIVIIDSTWAQSRSIYHNSIEIHNLPKVELKCNTPSNYLIRTQPTDVCLSTVETAAIALSYTENDDTIYEKLTTPLRAMCEFQIQHGAVSHHSKEYLITNGLYTKPLTKRIQQKLSNNEDIKKFIR